MNELFDLRGKVALVTGGNSGIGLGYARGLAKAGAAVAIWGRNPAKNAAAQDELEALGAPVLALRCDVAVEEEVEGAFAAVLERFGKVDACFANAGVPTGTTRFEEMTLDEWRRVMDVNLDGAFLTLRAAARHMKERGEGGSLVVTSSASSIFGMPRGEHYAASKAAVTALVRSLAVEYGRRGIRANAVVPGWIDTAMTEGLLASEPFSEKVLSRVPAGRWGVPADFEAIAVYFASDASAYHTGDTVVIDGGYSKF